MNTMRSDNSVITESYSVAVAAKDFATFVLSTSKSSGWQGRVAQRWDREMAHLVEYLRIKKIDEDRTALNYVYAFRTEVRDRIERLPAGDPRFAELDGFEQRMPTPQAFLKTDDRLSLGASLSDFAEYAVRVAQRGWKNWHEDVEARWVLDRAAMSKKTDATQKNYISRYRKAVTDRLSEEGDVREGLSGELMAIVSHPAELLQKVNAEYSRKVREGTRNLRPLLHWQELLLAFRNCLDSDNARLKMIGLMALTGRRFVEITSYGSFEPNSFRMGSAIARSKWMVRFSGQAKTRGAEGTMAGKTYLIPCLAPAKGIIAAMTWLRNSPEGKLWANMDGKELNAKVNGQLNRYLRTRSEFMRYWPKDDKLTTSCLRSYYAAVAYKAFAPSTMERTPYYAQILGHSETDLQTPLSYMDYTLDVEDTEAARQEMQRLIDRLNEEETARGKLILPPGDDQEADPAPIRIETDGEVIDDTDSS